jgi:transposase
MRNSYLPYEPEQQMLMPEALQDWLPAGHLAYFISDTVDSLDLSAFHRRYEGGGPRNQPFHPAMMVKVLVYGYATGVFSSRKMARKLHEDVAFRVLGAGNFPAHRTICDFRCNHLKELGELFVQVVKLAGECGLVKLGTIAVDGTKVRANASRHKAMSYGHMQKKERELKEQIAALLSRAQATDEAEKNEPELDIPAEIARRKERLAAIEAAKKRLEERQEEADKAKGRYQGDGRKPKNKDGKPRKGKPFKRDFGVPPEKAQESFTDPDSRIMKRSGGRYDYCYNAHTAVDEQAQIIVAAELTNRAPDNDRLPVLLQAVQENLGQPPSQVLADAGFRSESIFEQLKDSPVDLVVAVGREGNSSLKINAQTTPHTAAMATKLKSPQGQAAYRKRKWIAEAPNGWVKNVLGFRQFSFRGLPKVTAEWKLVCLALNLRRMNTLRPA